MKRILAQAFANNHYDLKLTSAPYLFKKRKRKISGIWSKKEKMSGGAGHCSRGFLNHSFVKWLTQLAYAEYGKASTKSALASDVVFFQPEGTLADDTSFNRVAGFLSLPILSLISGKKVICMNGTVPKYTGDTHNLVQFLFDHCFYATARDRLTSELYDCDFFPDAALAYQVNCSCVGDRKKLLITTGARNTEEEDLFIIDQAMKLAERSGLIPMVLTKSSRRFESRRESILSMGGEFLGSMSLEDAEMKLKDCALHFGGRYHMAIFALKFGVPSLLYSIRTHKNIWLSEEFKEIVLFDKSSDIFLKADDLLVRAGVVKWEVSENLTVLDERCHSVLDDLIGRIVKSSHLNACELFSKGLAVEKS